MKLYRIMKIDTDGKPMIGIRRNMLGVRPTDPANTDPRRQPDVKAVVQGDIVPAGSKQGLSVFADHVEIDTDVTKKDRLWVIDSDDLLQYSLVAAPDPLDGDFGYSHQVFEPERDTTIGQLSE